MPNAIFALPPLAAALTHDIDPVFVLTMATIACFGLAFALSLWALRRTGVPVYSAAPWIVRMAIETLNLKDGERFCDLGCGTGRVLRSARRAAKVQATGYELNPFAILYLWALSITDWNVRVRWRDFRRLPLPHSQSSPRPRRTTRKTIAPRRARRFRRFPHPRLEGQRRKRTGTKNLALRHGRAQRMILFFNSTQSIPFKQINPRHLEQPSENPKK